MKNKLIEKLDWLEWTVYEYEDGWELSKYSPAGEDFFVWLAWDLEDLEALTEECASCADGFDIEDHVRMWLEAKRNGVAGVPGVVDLVDDARAIKEMLDELAETIRDFKEVTQNVE